MNDPALQEILSELRRLRRLTQVGAYVSVTMVALLVFYLTVLRPQFVRQRTISDVEDRLRTIVTGEAESTWTLISRHVDRGDTNSALRVAQDAVRRLPQFHYAHSTLGSVYVAIGDYRKALSSYERAVELYPDERNEQDLAAVRKYLERSRSQ